MVLSEHEPLVAKDWRGNEIKCGTRVFWHNGEWGIGTVTAVRKGEWKNELFLHVLWEERSWHQARVGKVGSGVRLHHVTAWPDQAEPDAV